MSYEINGKKYDFNSSKNQSIKRKFVEREVIQRQSRLVEKLLSSEIDGFFYDNIENFERKVCPECSSENIEENNYHFSCNDCNVEFDSCDYETNEIYEWWSINSWFKEKLLIHEEPILDNYYGTWWGRCCTGQAILLG